MGTTHTTPLRRVLIASLTALLALAATGCLHGDVDVEVKGDGSGRIEVEVLPSAKLMDNLEKLPISIEDTVEGSFDGVDGVEFEEIESDGREGYRLTVPFDDYRDVQQVLVDGGIVAGQQVQLFSSFQITELPDGAGWTLDAQLLPLGQTIVGANEGQIPESMEELLDSAGIGNRGSGLDLSITLPGTIVTSNAFRIDGGTATWKLSDPEAPTVLAMRTEPAEFPTTAQLVVGGAALAVLLGLLFFVLGATRRHKSTKQPGRRAKKVKATAAAEQASTSGWAAPVPATAPSPSDRPEALPVLDTPPAAVPPSAAPPAAPIPPAPPAPPAPAPIPPAPAPRASRASAARASSASADPSSAGAADTSCASAADPSCASAADPSGPMGTAEPTRDAPGLTRTDSGDRRAGVSFCDVCTRRSVSTRRGVVL